MEQEKKTFFLWISSLRISYTIPFVFASGTGVVRGYFAHPLPWLCVWVLTGVFFMALFVNLANDYYDHLSGADKDRFDLSPEEKKKIYTSVLNEKIYWKGNVFDMGYLSEKQGKWLLAGLLICIGFLAIPIIELSSWSVFWFGFFGILIAITYTMPPVNLSARGLGEVAVLLSFFLLSFGSFWVFSLHWNIELYQVLFIAILVGFSAFIMRIADQLTGYESHKRTKQIDFSVQFGTAASISVIKATLLLVLTGYVFLGWFEHKFFLLLLNAPIMVKIWLTYRQENDPYRFLRVVPLALLLSISQSLLIIVCWLWILL